MKIKRILSTLLALLMVLGCFTAFGIVSMADEGEGEEALTTEEIAALSLSQRHGDPQSKIDTDKYMKLMAAVNGYQIYCNPYTGEVYYRNEITGQIVTTNPYDLSNYNQYTGDSTSTVGLILQERAKELMSQIEITFKNTEGETKTYNSYTEAAQRGQIKVKNIKNGIRVEYTIGRMNTTYLIPGWIEVSDYETLVIEPMEEYLSQFDPDSAAYEKIQRKISKFKTWYILKDPNVESKETLREWVKLYPCTVTESGEPKMAIYVVDEFNPKWSEGTRLELETLMKTYAPKFTYDTLATVHEKTGYTATNEASALFRISIEYTINTDGSLSVRVPGNSIRYDEKNYTLESIALLKYMGAINSTNEGYILYPDGSGSLVSLSNLYMSSYGISNQVYGNDNAYYDVTAHNSSQISMPVFGLSMNLSYMVHNTIPGVSVSEQLYRSTDWTDSNLDKGGDWHTGTGYTPADFQKKTVSTGYVVVVEEGESLMNFNIASGGSSHAYSSVFASFNPRPKDTYDLADTVSVSGNSKWTVVSENKFSGNFKYRVIMLTDDIAAAENGVTSYYPTTWVGMAKAYRTYLVNSGILTKLDESDVKENMPLYIETFGSIKTTTKFLSIPVTTNVALTTYEDAKTMYNELADKGIDNINFKLTGYYNGGLAGNYPSNLKFVRSTGGKSGFRKFLEYADEKDFGVFMDFDFTYSNGSKGVSYKKDASQTVDGKYASQQVYSPVYQEFIGFFDVCMNSDAISKYVDKLSKKYSKYSKYNDALGISVSTLGSDLNSDFNDKNAKNRETSKNSIADTLKSLNETYNGNVMTGVGNAYALKYANHILGASIDSNHNTISSYTVPLTGIVLHGYKNFTGTAINESGSPDYQILKSIENGSALYYVLSYDNTTYLKEDEQLNRYYSIRYDIWKDRLVEEYKALNDAIGGLQLYEISDHKFIKAERILDDVDISVRNKKLIETYKTLLETAIKEAYTSKLAEVRTAYENGYIGIGESVSIVIDSEAIYQQLLSILTKNLSSEQIEKAGLSKRLTASIKSEIDAVISAYQTPESEINNDVVTTPDGELTFKVEIGAITVNDSDPEADNYLNYGTTDSEALDKDYFTTDYTISDGSVVLVTYSMPGKSDVRFIINYNIYDITVKIGGTTYTIPAYGYIKI